MLARRFGLGKSFTVALALACSSFLWGCGDQGPSGSSGSRHITSQYQQGASVNYKELTADNSDYSSAVEVDVNSRLHWDPKADGMCPRQFTANAGQGLVTQPQYNIDLNQLLDHKTLNPKTGAYDADPIRTITDVHVDLNYQGFILFHCLGIKTPVFKVTVANDGDVVTFGMAGGFGDGGYVRVRAYGGESVPLLDRLSTPKTMNIEGWSWKSVSSFIPEAVAAVAAFFAIPEITTGLLAITPVYVTTLGLSAVGLDVVQQGLGRLFDPAAVVRPNLWNIEGDVSSFSYPMPRGTYYFAVREYLTGSNPLDRIGWPPASHDVDVYFNLTPAHKVVQGDIVNDVNSDGVAHTTFNTVNSVGPSCEDYKWGVGTTVSNDNVVKRQGSIDGDFCNQIPFCSLNSDLTKGCTTDFTKWNNVDDPRKVKTPNCSALGKNWLACDAAGALGFGCWWNYKNNDCEENKNALCADKKGTLLEKCPPNTVGPEQTAGQTPGTTPTPSGKDVDASSLTGPGLGVAVTGTGSADTALGDYTLPSGGATVAVEQFNGGLPTGILTFAQIKNVLSNSVFTPLLQAVGVTADNLGLRDVKLEWNAVEGWTGTGSFTIINLGGGQAQIMPVTSGQAKGTLYLAFYKTDGTLVTRITLKTITITVP